MSEAVFLNINFSLIIFSLRSIQNNTTNDTTTTMANTIGLWEDNRNNNSNNTENKGSDK